MGKAIPVGAFPSRSAAEDYCKSILAAARKREREMTLTQNEMDALSPLFAIHPREDVRRAHGYALRWFPYTHARGQAWYVAFCVIDADGKKGTIFSWRDAISMKVAFERLRHAVKPQIDVYRLEREALESDHVDHIEPFKDLCARWERESEWRVLDAMNGDMERRNAALADFAVFHQREATLRILPAAENLRRGRG